MSTKSWLIELYHSMEHPALLHDEYDLLGQVTVMSLELHSTAQGQNC